MARPHLLARTCLVVRSCLLACLCLLVRTCLLAGCSGVARGATVVLDTLAWCPVGGMGGVLTGSCGIAVCGIVRRPAPAHGITRIGVVGSTGVVSAGARVCALVRQRPIVVILRHLRHRLVSWRKLFNRLYYIRIF